MKKSITILVLLVGTALFAQQVPSLDPGLGITTIPLYSVVPSGMDMANVPTLTVFKPHPGHGTGSAVIIAPGGAYLGLASSLEGSQVAEWFAAKGFTAFVLKYRLGPQNLYSVPLLNVQYAIRLVRSLAKDYNLSTDRIGVAGFSAGGHLAAMAATSEETRDAPSVDPIDLLSARPDFVVLGYPWLNAMEPRRDKEITYCSMMHNLSAAQCDALTNPYTPKLHVTKNTPPTFIYATSDDVIVPVRASVEFYEAMILAGASVEMHLFRHGAHGSGLGGVDATLDEWIPQMLSTNKLRKMGWFGTVDSLESYRATLEVTP